MSLLTLIGPRRIPLAQSLNKSSRAAYSTVADANNSDFDENLRYVRRWGLIAISFRPTYNPFPGTKSKRARLPQFIRRK